jgi:hypothetical protein
MPLAIFSSGYFGDKVLLFAQACVTCSDFKLPVITGMTDMYQYTQCIGFFS